MDNLKTIIKEKDEELGIGPHDWYVKEDRTEDKLMHDIGKGDAVIIRLFEWSFPPTLEFLPTKEQIITDGYLKQIDIQLWSDGLRRVMEPRVTIDKSGCKVFVPCVARTGQNIIDSPKLLQEWI